MRTVEKPLLFVDVDGVINCLLAMNESGAGTKHLIDGAGPILVPHGVPDRLRVLEDHFEPVWATAWFDRAVTHLAPVIGVGDTWPVLRWGDMKIPDIIAFARDRRWAFIDDDMDYELRELADLGVVDDPDRILLVEIDGHVGLTDAQTGELIAFAGGGA